MIEESKKNRFQLPFISDTFSTTAKKQDPQATCMHEATLSEDDGLAWLANTPVAGSGYQKM